MQSKIANISIKNLEKIKKLESEMNIVLVAYEKAENKREK